MDQNEIRLVQQMITEATKGLSDFTLRKRGDTPTDNYHLVPKSYLDTRVGNLSSVLGNFTVKGSASIVGNLTVGSIISNGISIPAVYTGVVQSNGTASSPFPSGWTSSIAATGNYIVTHLLGTTNYGLVTTSSGFVATIGAINSGTFNVFTFNPTGSFQNSGFEFILVKP